MKRFFCCFFSLVLCSFCFSGPINTDLGGDYVVVAKSLGERPVLDDPKVGKVLFRITNETFYYEFSTPELPEKYDRRLMSPESRVVDFLIQGDGDSVMYFHIYPYPQPEFLVVTVSVTNSEAVTYIVKKAPKKK